MEIVKIKVLSEKPFTHIDRNWFPYRNVIDTNTFDDDLCVEIEEAIAQNGKRKVTVFYNIEEVDSSNRPTRILAGYKVKGNPNDWSEYLFNTIYHDSPLRYQCSFGLEPDVDPFIYKRFMSAEDYIEQEGK